MREDIEKLIAHYKTQVLKEINNGKKNKERLKTLEKVVVDLEDIIKREDEKNNQNKKHNHSNNAKPQKQQEYVKSTIEPELVQKKSKKQY